MNKTILLNLLAAAVLAAIMGWMAGWPIGLAQQVGHPGNPAQLQEGFVLLRNGQMLRGWISRVGERYVVRVDGGEISVRASEVQSVCHTLDEAYQQRRARIQPDNINERLELAQWCQHQGLLGAAAQELAEAMAIDPHHPMIPVVERRLKLAVDQPQRVERLVRSERAPSPDELDRLVRGMPPGTVETFTQTIQPLLVNNCTASGCHGPGAEQGFSLLRPPIGRPPSRRLTQRNLLATLQWINRADPASSPLLVAPTRPHGTARAPIFTDNQLVQYQELIDWVYKVARVPSPVNVSRHREGNRRPVAAVQATHHAPITPGEPAGAQPGEVSHFGPGLFGGPGIPGNSYHETERRQAASKPGYRRAQPIPTVPPTVPADPDLSNRQPGPSVQPPPPEVAPPTHPQKTRGPAGPGS